MADTSGFARAFAVVIGEEGDYSNDRADPGGETKYGISKRAYPNVDIANLTLEGARALYARDYWTPAACDRMGPALALLVFDAAVNNGIHKAVPWLQTAVGASPDGRVGDVTIRAIATYVARHGMAALLTEYLAVRLHFMAGLPTWPTFGLGWSRRLCGLAFQAAALQPLIVSGTIP